MNNSCETSFSNKKDLDTLTDKIIGSTLIVQLFFFPIGICLSTINNLIIIVIVVWSRKFYEKTSKTSRIYYCALAIGQLFGEPFNLLPILTSTSFIFLIQVSKSSYHNLE